MSDTFRIEYFTDPLCCWSWALEPQLRKLRFLLKGRLVIRYVMGGLLRDWENFSDPLNSIEHPSQFGPLWMEAKHTSGQPMDESIWIENPVDTSYLACLAVKAAEITSPQAGEALLRELREAVMMHRKNIARKEVIMDIVRQLDQKKMLNFQEFAKNFSSEQTAELFRQDLNLVKIKNISRFPSLLITYDNRTLQITGYRPFTVLLDAFKALNPLLELEDEIDPEVYRNSWEFLTQRELQEIQCSSMKLG